MPVRRIVTGHSPEGRSQICSDQRTPDTLHLGLINVEEIWLDDPAGADIADPVATPTSCLVPPKGGSRIRLVTFPPDRTLPPITPEGLAQLLTRFSVGDAELDPANPAWHRTLSLDYGVVMSGTITLLVDEGERQLQAGDVVVQRATRHAWRNDSDQACVMLFVLIDKH